MNRLPWAAAFAVAIGLHAVIAFGLLFEASAPPLASGDFGDGGVVLGLAASDASVVAAAAVASADTPAAEPDQPAPAAPVPAEPTPIATPPFTATQEITPREPPPAIATTPPTSPPVIEPAPATATPPVPAEVPQTVAQTPAAPTPPPALPTPPPAAAPAPAAATLATLENTERPAPNASRQAASNPAPTSAGGARPGHSARAPGAGGTGDPAAARDYFRELMAWLARHKAYPVAAKKAKHQGIVTLEFAIERSGRVLSARVKNGSGYAALDQAALDMVARANPVPAIPAALARDRLSLAIPIEFSLITK